MKRQWRGWLLVAALGLVVATAALAAPGGLDQSFGGDGTVTTAIGPGDDFAEGVAVWPNGSVVAAGGSFDGVDLNFAVARYTKDGSLDPGFGGDGIVTTALSPGFDEARAVVPLPNGKIVAAGRAFTGTDQDFALVRYKEDGSLDPSFGGDGIVTTPVSAGTDEILAIARLAGSKLVVAGRSFDADGIVLTSFGAGVDEEFGVAVRPTGKIVAAGRSFNGTDFDLAVARYTKNGSLDAGFGSAGTLTTSVGLGDDSAASLALRANGDIVVAGSSFNGANLDFALARYSG